MNQLSLDEPGAALTRCTGLDRGSFSKSYWAQRPLLSQHSDGFTDLLSSADIDELINERGLRTPFFRMVKDGQALPAVTRSATAGNRRISDLVDADSVRERYAEGSTLVLQSLHRIHPPLVRFCRELAAELGHATQCNAYLTPPGSQGFAPHHDTHDVFVLQVDGHKRWHIYAPAIELPLTSQPSQDLETLVPEGAEPVLSVVLGPGDALYLPRGYVHSAETNEDRSLHLTIGVLAATAYDVLRDVLALAAREPAFRRSLPLGSPEDQLAPVSAIVSAAAQWLRELPEAALQEAVRARVTSVAGPEPLGMLAAEDALRELDKDTLVRPRVGVPHSLDLDDESGRALLSLPDRAISLPGYVASAVAALLESEQRVGELDLPVDDSIVLVRRLMKEGVLTAVSHH